MSNTGSTLGGAGGAAIGAAFGGPAGAQIGGSLGGMLGGLFDKRDQTPSKSVTTREFMNESQLQRGFNEADLAFDRAKAAGPFQGQTYQGLTPEQQAILSRQGQFARGNQAAAGQVIDASGRLVGAGADFGLNAQNLFSEAMGRDPNATREQAFRFSQGPETDALIDSASRDVARTLGENTLPNLQNAITNAGGRNSSRAGAAEAVARRGAEDRVADLSANIRQSQFDREFDRLRTSERDRMGDLFGANEALGRSFSAGTSGLGAGIAQSGSLFGMESDAADATQRDMQNRLNDNRSNFERLRMDDFDILGRYQGAVGPALTKTTTTTGNPSQPEITMGQAVNQGSQTGFNMGELFGSFMGGGSPGIDSPGGIKSRYSPQPLFG